MSSPRTCTACDNPAADGVTICRRCEKDTKRRLGDQAELHTELEVTLSRQTQLSEHADGSRSANKPLPYAELASVALSAQRAILVSWAKLCHDDIDGMWPIRDTIGAIALHIEYRMPELRKHAAAGDLVTEIRNITLQALAAMDYPDDRHKANVGNCIIALEDGSQCPGQIVLHFPTEGETYADCGCCRSKWEGHQLNRLGRRIMQQGAA